jgi:hypothetical protein
MTTTTIQNDANSAHTFESIHDHIQGAGVDALSQGGAKPPVSGMERLLAAYAAVRPILAALSVLSLVPAQWRLALRVFVSALDEVTGTRTGDAAAADFKAGKDL